MAGKEDNWGLVEPFDVDNGQLDGLTLGQAFSLGVEFSMVREKLKQGKPFRTLVVDRNVERIVKMVERHGHFCEWNKIDTCPEWVALNVGNKKEG